MSDKHTNRGAPHPERDTVPRKTALRTELRARRRALSDAEQLAAAHAVARRLEQLPEWLAAQRVALYVAADGELDPLPLAKRAGSGHKQVYLPVITDTNTLVFRRWDDASELTANRFGIPEPLSGARAEANDLDCILTPLVGWDSRGNRLGMGGGFYDRTLRNHSGPTLIGLAHDCQQLAAIPQQAWDIRMDFVATPSGLHICRIND